MKKPVETTFLEKCLFYFWHKTRSGKEFRRVLQGKNAFILRHWKMRAEYFLLDVKDRKVDKKFIITLMEDPPSLEAAEKCRQSIRRHGGREAEYFAAVDERRSQAVLKEHGVAWISIGTKGSRETLMGCFASHFLLWLKCMEMDEPIMIFESDALCVRTLPSRLRFRHVINLADGDYRRSDCVAKEVTQFLDKNPYSGSVCYDSPRMPGAVAYAVSPDGARRLVKEAKTDFACEADEFMEKRIVDIVEHHPLPVELNADFPSYLERKSKQDEKEIGVMKKPGETTILEKCLYHFWHKTRSGKEFRRVLQGKNAFILRHWKMRAEYFLLDVKDRKVDKKFIITLMEDPPSLEAAEKCRQSIRRHGGREAEYFTAVDERRSQAVLKEHGVRWISQRGKTGLGPRSSDEALMGCFASHFLLWLKCMEMDEPIMIFESDALCVRALPSRLRFRHVINLADGYCRRDCITKETAQFLDKNPYGGSVCYDSPRMPGAVAYAVSPDGARRLVKKAKTDFACEADELMEKRIVDIVEHHPLPVELNADFPSYLERKNRQAEKKSS